MPKFGSVRFSGVFAWTMNQNRTARRGCIEPPTGPAELGSNSVRTELNLQFFVDILSGKKECGEVLTSVCYVGKHVGPVKWGVLTPHYPFSELSILRIGTRSCLFLLHPFVRACMHMLSFICHSSTPARTLVRTCSHRPRLSGGRPRL